MTTLFSQVEQDGFVFIPQWEPSKDTGTLVRNIGDVVALSGDDPVHPLRAIEREQTTPNTYSGNYGLDAFPMHTDLAHWCIPPRYLMLRCQVGYAEVSTPVMDGRDLFLRNSDLSGRVLVKPRRPLQGSMRLLRLCEQVGSHWLFRWDQLFLQAASLSGINDMSMYEVLIRFHEKTSIVLKDKGDTVIIDNWRMIHGRDCIPPQCSDRLLERVYLQELFS